MENPALVAPLYQNKILPCSHYTYCEAVWSQRKEDLIKVCENALHFYGGVPIAIVPDNLKSAVTRSDRNEPIINDDFAAFAEHYSCAVYPARVRHPKNKALVENAVKLMYKSVYADIEGLMFHDIESLKKIERCPLLILDDLFLVPLDAKERPILLDIIEDRHERKPIIVTSQLPVADWYDAIGDPTVADAILDRIVHSAHQIELTGESVRKMKVGKNK